MPYISNQNEYPRFIGDVQIVNPNFQEGDELPEGWSQVIEVEPPTIGPNEVYEELEPELLNGVYYQRWITRSMTQEEIADRDAPKNAKQRFIDLGFTDPEIKAIANGLLRL